MKDRIKQVRKLLNLSQVDFGSRLGLSLKTISSYETGRSTPNEPTIKTICREYHVDPTWLMHGIGEPFIEMPEDTLTRLCEEYNLSRTGERILRVFLSLSEDDKDALIRFATSLAEETKKDRD